MLKGKQKKLDKNNNGRIDAEDFKLLKADKPMKAAMGKSVRGYGAARTSGTGLMDEQMAPGKVMNARVGKSIDKKAFMKTLGVFPKINKPGMGEAKDYKKYLKGLKEATKSKSAKKASDIAMKAAKSTRLGKIALGIAGAGIAAKEYLKRKKEKKMGGGMMNKPMGYKDGRSISTRGGGVDASILGKFRDISAKGGFRPIPTDTDRITQRDMEKVKSLVKKRNRKEKMKSILKRGIPATAAAGLVKRSLDILKGSKSPKSGMGGAGRRGSIDRRPAKKIEVMEARTGQMVMARGCKLGRKKATKIT